MSILPTSASLMLTENCNLACTYCFERHNASVMSDGIIKKSLDFLFNNAKKQNLSEVSIILFGGEPLLNPHGIHTALEYGLYLSQTLHIKLTTSLITNATVMTDEIFYTLRTYRDLVNLNVQLSVDGVPEVQNKYRLTKNGNPSFDMVQKNITRFKELYDYNIDDARLSVHGCVTKETMPYLSDSYLFFRGVLGFKRIWFLAICEEDWNDTDIKEYDRQCKIIYKHCIKDIQNAVNKTIEADNYAPFSRYNTLGCKRNLPCGAGRSFVSISTNGDIYPCHQIYFHDEYKDTRLGNVIDGTLDEDRRKIFLRYEEPDMGCGDCPNSSCYRCLAANWIKNGSILSQIKGMYCKMSGVEHKYQSMLKDYMEQFNGSNTQDKIAECLCHSRQCSVPQSDLCDIVRNNDFCNSGNNPDNINCLCDVRS